MAKQLEKETRIPFEMNLQLFSDSQPSDAQIQAQALAFLKGDAPVQAQQAPMDNMQMEQPGMDMSNPQNSPQNSENSGQVPMEGQQTPNQPAVPEQPSQQAPSQQEMLLGKFKSPEELANGYVNVEKAFSQKAQEAAALQQQLQAAQQQMQQMQQQIQSVVNPQQTEQVNPEQENEQLVNALLTNPKEALSQLLSEMLGQQLQPLQQQLQPLAQQYQTQQRQQAFNQAIDQFAAKTPDIEVFRPVMTQVLAQNPELQFHPGGPEAAINIAYQMAKGQQYQNPSDLLQNQDFVKQNIVNNEAIRNQIIQDYLQQMKQNNQAPVVISGQANGSMPVVPENRPQTTDEARAAALKYLQG